MCGMKKLGPPDFKPVLVRKLQIIHPTVWGHNDLKKLFQEKQSESFQMYE